MTPLEIKVRMLQKGISSADLAREWRKSKATISHLINRKAKFTELERKLARKLGVKVSDLRGEQNP